MVSNERDSLAETFVRFGSSGNPIMLLKSSMTSLFKSFERSKMRQIRFPRPNTWVHWSLIAAWSTAVETIEAMLGARADER